jgi:hypothetical protein
MLAKLMGLCIDISRSVWKNGGPNDCNLLGFSIAVRSVSLDSVWPLYVVTYTGCNA